MSCTIVQRLAIFPGSFSGEAATELLSPGETEQTLSNLIGALIRLRSLEVEEHTGGRRYRLSEEFRQAGRAALVVSGEEPALFSRLADYYLGFARRSLNNAFGPAREVWMDRLEQEHPNLQAIFQWLIECSDALRGLRLAYLLQELWFEDRHTSEGRQLFSTLLDLPEAQNLGIERAECLDLAGAYALNQEDYEQARALKQQGVELCRQLGDEQVLGSSLIHLGHVELFAGNFSMAHGYYREALENFTRLEEPVWIARAAGNLSNTALEMGDYEQASKLVKESLKRFCDQELEWELAGEIGIAAGMAAGLGQLECAIRLAAASSVHRERMGVSLPPVFQQRFEKLIEPARTGLAAEVQERLWEEGCRMSLEQAVEEALSCVGAAG